MYKTKIFLRTIALLLVIGLLSCGYQSETADKAEYSEKGATEKFTDKTAKEAVGNIRTPINKARAVKTTGENKMKNMDEMVNQ